MVQEHVDHMRARIDEIAPGAREAGDGARALRAYVQANREKLATMRPSAGLFAFIASEPELIAPAEELRDEISALADACADPARAAIVVLACKGITFETILDTGGRAIPDDVFTALADMAGSL